MAIHVYDYKGQNRCCQLYRNDSQKICLRIILGLLVGGGGREGAGAAAALEQERIRKAKRKLYVIVIALVQRLANLM